MSPPGGAILTPLSEAQFAAWLALRGERVVCHEGRYWRARSYGFFHALHPMAQLSRAEATRPDPLCWGFRTSLSPADAHLANATLPLHVLDPLQDYDISRLKPRRRNQVRNCFRQITVVALETPALLFDQGYAVVSSARARTGYGVVGNIRKYRRSVENFFAAPGGMILAGLIDGRLGGYFAGYAIGSTAYIESVELATEALATNISSGLFLAWVEACQRAGTITRLVHGLHTPENPSLCQHKASLGLKIVHLPARAWFLPPAERLLKRLKPFVYYRLTGVPTLAAAPAP